MIGRLKAFAIKEVLGEFPAVVIIGPRQVGKTTLALKIAEEVDSKSIYLDLESPSDLKKLEEAEEYFSLNEDKLIILDEIQRTPEIFKILRGVIDKRRRKGIKVGQFLILGSASLDLIRQSSESLAGRIAYEELSVFNLKEIYGDSVVNNLWLRGGFPDSYLANSDLASLRWRQNFITTYLERDIPQIANFIPSNRLRRLWTMLAHQQGCQINMSQLGASLDLTSPTVKNYVELLEDLLLIRTIRPWYSNSKKRLVKTPKVYIRDSGVLHALLTISNLEDLLSHPVVGFSWEGFVIENLIAVLPRNAEFWYYRTSAGAEIDFVIVFKMEVWAIEIKKTWTPKLSKGFISGCDDIQATKRYFVYSGKETYPIGSDTFVVPLSHMMDLLQSLTDTGD
ncbi:ATP-binding protein [Mongoliitalea daihaiensis]|uniref:ATP-binding protein n=1 Tax=Mongoliitalea daihaiensis TaxID=2782006 RepID=UPI001F16608E|nr:ATP-binding protein [Mongoliitalea daihaiensis]UJP65333.1 ATP-binding protein [Mongoliitalea daihaiensis]